MDNFLLIDSGSYNVTGDCFFKTTNGDTLRLSHKDCMEVFITLSDVYTMPFDRDDIAQQIADTLGI